MLKSIYDYFKSFLFDCFPFLFDLYLFLKFHFSIECIQAQDY